MLKKTVDRIVNNHDIGLKTVIGRYTYSLRFNQESNTFWVVRCKTEDIGRCWILFDGSIVDSWKPVLEVK